MLHAAKGTCYSIFVYDVAFAIDLNAASQRITSLKQRESMRHRRRTPKYFEYHTPPLRIIQDDVECVLYDFGAVSVIYRMLLTPDGDDLLGLSTRLYENEELLKDSRRRVEALLQILESAMSKPNIADSVEDYLIFHVEEFAEPTNIAELATRHRRDLAQFLRSEFQELSDDEVTDALSHRISYGTEDVAIVDWNAALVVDKDPEDIIAVLEFANVELLEMRFLDQRLDNALDRAYERIARRSKSWRSFGPKAADLREISQWQVDSAILFEGVNNVLKLIGDQYLARLYSLVAARFHLTEWDSSILRKLETLERIYEKISDQLSTRRMEVLEWIVIILIVVEIVLPFVLPHR